MPEQPPDKIKLLIVDDHTVVRTGIGAVLELEPDLQVVGEAATGEEALARVKLQSVDVILMDVIMPGMGGIAACREIRQSYPETKVLMLTSAGDEEAVMASLLAGASGYLLKNVSRQDLIKAIRDVYAGRSILDPETTAKITRKLIALASPQAQETSTERAKLSPREQEVLVLVAQGMTNKEIARKLVIAEKTARNHVSRILEKLGLTRRSQAAAWAVKHGLLGN